ncbi:MAG: VOC family protein [Thermoplasmata archaeon]|nr:VOC family protein [Thermoplasmata archaeon]MCI4333407.1 VOC family protein [Thermoplasmata archaeon]
MYLSYVGFRVRDLPKSVKFYTEVFGMVPVQPEELATMDPTRAGAILLRDPGSGGRIELNYYPPGSPYAVPYTVGESLDHIAFRVDDLEQTLARLESLGYPPERMAHYEGRLSASPTLRMAYVRDPDGMELELFHATGSPEFSPERY